MSASMIVRSIRTARLNRELPSLYDISWSAIEAEIAALPMEAVDFASLIRGRVDVLHWVLQATVMPDVSSMVMQVSSKAET